MVDPPRIPQDYTKTTRFFGTLSGINPADRLQTGDKHLGYHERMAILDRRR
jgi:hypothetical protein